MVLHVAFKIAVNIGVIAAAARFLPGFSVSPYALPYQNLIPHVVTPLWQTLIIGGAALGISNIILSPILKVIAALLPLITFPILLVAFNSALLFFADRFFLELSIAGTQQLLTVGLVLGILNAIR